MRRHIHLFLLAVGFDLYWTLVVVFRERGLALWFALAILAWLRLPPSLRLYALLLAAAGCVLDVALARAGLIAFHGESILPLWMVALWLMFSAMWTQLTTSTTLPGWILAFLATFGGPIAYTIGERLGAIAFQKPALAVLGVMAAGWLAIMLLFHVLMGRRQ